MSQVVVTGIGVCAPPVDRPAADAWFDVRTRLGRRGYKYLPAACQYLLVAGRDALDDAGNRLDGVAEQGRGVVVGTNNGVAALHDEQDRTVIAEHASELSPVTAPYGAVNVLTSRLSMEHGFTGISLTLISPLVAGLESVQVGARAFAAGRATMLLAGAMEQAVPAPEAAAPEEGSVILVLEPPERARARGVTGYGQVSVRTLLLPPHGLAAGPTRNRAVAVVREAASSLGAGQVPVHALLDDSAVGELVAGAMPAGVDLVRDAGPPAAGSLTPMLRLADRLRAGDGDSLLVTAAGTGNVAMVRIWRTAGSTRRSAGC
ncbi:beta-ketoacyl synthase N-terminal-like domain-containing protein [Micromonospora sp. WMMD1102]|uniref:beta-ketoacyl synthase N-terminal-like domain-containing protein n=1 Tax=Micromonospora sp. WMMD1102 TaxID=3016105 RepID=UPI0024157F25|nr:beta-ketoacyl synthase N-terminal-like domain-containing protein [Micromonospora sp. WMMD1102]MDG4786424.1 beta-ketoacyl synthase N-terminal-like domain-containing protein [Micromonospora sp. WMMD1102]